MSNKVTTTLMYPSYRDYQLFPHTDADMKKFQGAVRNDFACIIKLTPNLLNNCTLYNVAVILGSYRERPRASFMNRKYIIASPHNIVVHDIETLKITLITRMMEGRPWSDTDFFTISTSINDDEPINDRSYAVWPCTITDTPANISDKYAVIVFAAINAYSTLRALKQLSKQYRTHITAIIQCTGQFNHQNEYFRCAMFNGIMRSDLYIGRYGMHLMRDDFLLIDDNHAIRTYDFITALKGEGTSYLNNTL